MAMSVCQRVDSLSMLIHVYPVYPSTYRVSTCFNHPVGAAFRNHPQHDPIFRPTHVIEHSSILVDKLDIFALAWSIQKFRTSYDDH